jgi:hypothetical protein
MSVWRSDVEEGCWEQGGAGWGLGPGRLGAEPVTREVAGPCQCGPQLTAPVRAIGAGLDGEPVRVALLVHLDVGDECVQLLEGGARDEGAGESRPRCASRHTEGSRLLGRQGCAHMRVHVSWTGGRHGWGHRERAEGCVDGAGRHRLGLQLLGRRGGTQKQLAALQR